MALSPETTYPGIPANLRNRIDFLKSWAELRHEEGADVAPVLRRVTAALDQAVRKLEKLPVSAKSRAQEPDDLRSIRKLRPKGPRRLWKKFDAMEYRRRLPGALLSRSIGCTLGAIVEFWEVKKMEDWAKNTGDKFPPVDYWTTAETPDRVRYTWSTCIEYTRGAMDGVPVDDDLAYMQLGLLIAEEYGLGFTTRDVGKAWVKYLPIAYTAEVVTLDNLKKGLTLPAATLRDNPYVQWIGADIRCDPWAYMAPGWPEKAAELAYRDAFVSHRRNGVYGAMFFAAAISAAFALDDPFEALAVGLTEIPRDCALARDVKWAIRTAPRVKNYRQARDTVDARFKGMSGVHTNINACLTIFGLGIGRKNLVKTLGETVAMGWDNDCTAATAGSILGAVLGKSKVPAYLTRPFHNTMHSYLKGKPLFRIDDLFRRFERQAVRVFEGSR